MGRLNFLLVVAAIVLTSGWLTAIYIYLAI